MENIENKLHHSHDKLFRETWSDRDNARSFLENYLPLDDPVFLCCIFNKRIYQCF
ncbi:Rpn family recombination-promoting nuclease/putative transposase [Desulfobacter postgatei]|uniref:Rpn family recombination-promoting nuclease/putative transposase n=1 Tax=Desulfobacter postgatei TaxID=2293 RepID=UPI00387E12E6